MSLPYSEFPVYISAVGASSVNESQDYVTATNVNVNYNTATAPKRNLGKNVAITDQFKFSGPLSASISVSCILESGQVDAFRFLLDANQDNFVCIRCLLAENTTELRLLNLVRLTPLRCC
jgi:hypothetical protein